MMRAIAIAAALVGGCTFSADYEPGLACGAGESCPEDQACRKGVCVYAPACSIAAAAGDGHTCSVRKDGTVWCWGRNDFGQLGDGTNRDSNEPVQVHDIETATAVATGGNHSCALLEEKTVKCWGLNERGQLGTDDIVDANEPVFVKTLEGIAEITAGTQHTCARNESGTVWCWGGNDARQIGVVGTHLLPVEVPIRDADRVVAASRIVAGARSTCAISVEGTLWCWGNNDHKKFGNPAGTWDTPAQVTSFDPTGGTAFVPIPQVTSVGVSIEHLCAVSTATGIGKVWCMGIIRGGRLGGSDTSTDEPFDSSKFVAVKDLTADIVEVAVSEEHSCARDGGGQVWCWGANYRAQLANGDKNVRPKPGDTELRGAVQLALGRRHTCIRDQRGAVWCGGDNPYGQLANRERTSQQKPQRVRNSSGVERIAAGGNATCSADRDGNTKCWGSTYIDNLVEPTPVPKLPVGTVTGLAVGDTYACAALNGEVWCWGNNKHGQLGDGTSDNSRRDAMRVVGLTTARDVAAGVDHTCARLDDGTVHCWGYNEFGKLGIAASGGDETIPVKVSSLQSAAAISIGKTHSCALLEGGTVQCWGDNQLGQLGDGAATMPSPVAEGAGTLVGVTQIDAHASRTYALIGNAATALWGQCEGTSGSDQVNCGTLTKAQRFAATFDEIAAGDNLACGRSGASVACWGRNQFGQLGTGTYLQSTTPVPVELSDVRQIAAGEEHACALHNDGTVSCWGRNTSGQLGDGAVTRPNPSGARLVCD